MKKIYFLLLLACISTACSLGTDSDKLVVIETKFGNMTVALYDETPKHKANFLNLADGGEYNGTIFHRVIRDFMVQGGGIDIKEGNSGVAPSPDQLLDNEIRPNLFHEKGTLAAARQEDSVNPDKLSSWCQFYIVQGKIYTEEELNNMARQINLKTLQPIMQKLLASGTYPAIDSAYNGMQARGEYQQMNTKMFDCLPQLEEVAGSKIQLSSISEEAKKAYTSIGGTPFLDNNYTVFGKVLEGLEVIDSIAAQPTNNMGLPQEEIIIKMEVIKMAKADIATKYGFTANMKPKGD